MNVIPTASRIEQLAAIVAAQLDMGTLHLFKNNITPNKNTLLADLVVADFDGYAGKAIAAWGAEFLDPLGLATTVAPLQTWTSTGQVTPNTIYGCYYRDAGGDLVYAEKFANPVFFAITGDTLNLVPKYQVGEILPAA
jgi:hypothetical protein